MNNRPMMRPTSVSKKGRRAGISIPRTFAAANPMTMAAMSPVSSRTMSHATVVAITADKLGHGAQLLTQPHHREQKPQQRSSYHAAGQPDPDARDKLREHVPVPKLGSRHDRGE